MTFYANQSLYLNFPGPSQLMAILSHLIFLYLTKFFGHIVLIINFVFSKKATKNDEIFIVDLTLHDVKSKVKISQNFVAFSEYMNFTKT